MVRALHRQIAKREFARLHRKTIRTDRGRAVWNPRAGESEPIGFAKQQLALGIIKRFVGEESAVRR